MNDRINRRELATVLAALRLWEKQLTNNRHGIHADLVSIAEDAGPMLGVTEVSELCERLNAATSKAKGKK